MGVDAAMTESQRTAQAALARMYRAFEREAGVRLTADEVHALMTQTILGEVCSRAQHEMTEPAQETS